jgi:hypothetical protein
MRALWTVFLLVGVLRASDFPEGYELNDDTRSPDGRYALLYPDGPNEKERPNLLVQLNPFKVLAEIRPGVPLNATQSVSATWNGPSVAAIHQSRRWGLVGLWVYELDGDKVKRVHPVLEEVRKVFQKDFQERVHPKFPEEPETLIFVSDEDDNSEADFVFKDRKLALNLCADNKPNLAPGVHWSAGLKADWNLDAGELENVRLTRGPVEWR